MTSGSAQLHPTCEALERARSEMFRVYQDEYRDVGWSLGVFHAGSLSVMAHEVFRRLRDVLVYVDDSVFTGSGHIERLARPLGVLRRGGDCDDFVCLHGGILRANFPDHLSAFASVYRMDERREPRHVFLSVQGTCFDLVSPSWFGPLPTDPEYEIVPWNLFG